MCQHNLVFSLPPTLHGSDTFVSSCPDVTCTVVTAGRGSSLTTQAHERLPTDTLSIGGPSDRLQNPTHTLSHTHKHSQERRALLMIKFYSHFIAGTHMATANPDEFTQINSCQTAGQCKPHPTPVSEGGSVQQWMWKLRSKVKAPSMHCNQIGGGS